MAIKVIPDTRLQVGKPNDGCHVEDTFSERSGPTFDLIRTLHRCVTSLRRAQGCAKSICDKKRTTLTFPLNPCFQFQMLLCSRSVPPSY
jgi:hypothetical protein